MRLFRTTALVLLASALALTTASAQSGYPEYYVDGRVLGSVQADGLHLQIAFDEHPWGGKTWTVEPAGVDVYRRGIGADCGPWERITDEPVPWSWTGQTGGAAMSFELVDPATSPGHGYLYEARAVDGNRDAIPEDGDVYIGAVTNGVALLAHATLEAGPGGCGLSSVQTVAHCSNNWNGYPDAICYPPLLFAWTPEIIPYVNTGSPLLLYGVIDEIISPCGANETVVHFSVVVEDPCALSVETRTWGSVKAIYR